MSGVGLSGAELFDREDDRVVRIRTEEEGNLFVRLQGNENGEVLLWLSNLPYDQGTDEYAVVGLYKAEARSLCAALTSDGHVKYNIFEVWVTQGLTVFEVQYEEERDGQTTTEKMSAILSKESVHMLRSVILAFCGDVEFPDETDWFPEDGTEPKTRVSKKKAAPKPKTKASKKKRSKSKKPTKPPLRVFKKDPSGSEEPVAVKMTIAPVPLDPPMKSPEKRPGAERRRLFEKMMEEKRRIAATQTSDSAEHESGAEDVRPDDSETVKTIPELLGVSLEEAYQKRKMETESEKAKEAAAAQENDAAECVDPVESENIQA